MIIGTGPTLTLPRAFERKRDTASEDFVRNTNTVAEGIARMQGHTRDDPGAVNLITPLLEAAQQLHDDAWDVYDARFLDRAPLAGLIRMADVLGIPAPDVLGADALRALVDAVARARHWDGREASLVSVLAPLSGHFVRGGADGRGLRIYFPALAEYHTGHYRAFGSALDAGGGDVIWSDALAAPYVLGHRSADGTAPGGDWTSADGSVAGAAWPATERPVAITPADLRPELNPDPFWLAYFDYRTGVIIDPSTERVKSWTDVDENYTVPISESGPVGWDSQYGVTFDGSGGFDLTSTIGAALLAAQSGNSPITLVIHYQSVIHPNVSEIAGKEVLGLCSGTGGAGEFAIELSSPVKAISPPDTGRLTAEFGDAGSGTESLALTYDPAYSDGVEYQQMLVIAYNPQTMIVSYYRVGGGTHFVNFSLAATTPTRVNDYSFLGDGFVGKIRRVGISTKLPSDGQLSKLLAGPSLWNEL